MKISVSLLNAKRAKRLLASVIVCGLTIVLPACQIPALRVAEPGPELPANFDSPIGGPPVMPPAIIPTGGPARNTTIVPAGGPAHGVTSGVTITPAGGAAAGTMIYAGSGTTIITPDGTRIITANGTATAPTAGAAARANSPISGATLIATTGTAAGAAGGALVPPGGTTTGPASVPTNTVVAAPVLGPGCPPGGQSGPENSGQLGIEEFYNDPLLTRLIQQAVAGNRELKVLEQEAQIASNEILARRGAILPLISFGALSGFEKTSHYTRNGSVEDQLLLGPRDRTFPNPLPDTRVGVDLTWQLDIWRQLRNSRDAAIQRYISAVERRNAYVNRLVAEVAENYYELMALDRRNENLDQTIKLQEDSYEIAKARVVNVRANELSVQRFLAEVRKNQSEKLIIKQEIVQAENRINFLINRYPEPVERATTGFYDLTIHALSVGVPSQLLQNRPDIRQAERELAAAGLDVKVARARFYPALTITAGVGYEAFNPRYLFDPEAFAANLAGGLVAPLVNKKAIQADYLSANSRQLEAVYNYQRVVLNAFTEVVNRVNMVENYRKSLDIKKQQLEALQESVDIAGKLFTNARLEYVEVLFSQRDLRDARMVLIDTKKQQLTAIVNAYQALGGGNSLAMAPSPAAIATHNWSWKFWQK